MAGIKKIALLLFIMCVGSTTYGQINSGRIVFERKTNLVKKFNDERTRQWLGDNKSKVDKFELFFNDTCSVFKPILGDVQDPMSWATQKNTIYQNLSSGDKMSILDLWGQSIWVTDSVSQREWKVTDNKRKISGYNCRKAIWQKDDTTRIYAWYSVDIIPSVGPETFNGLPGTILGLATEDGGIIYFATEVEAMKPTKEQLSYNVGKNKVFTMEELRAKLEKDFANQPWGKRVFVELFRWF